MTAFILEMSAAISSEEDIARVLKGRYKIGFSMKPEAIVPFQQQFCTIGATYEHNNDKQCTCVPNKDTTDSFLCRKRSSSCYR